jgi:predicted transcriptional regulator YheO
MDKEIDMNEHQRQEFLEFLDELRESGVVNMYGAAPYLVKEFGMPKMTAYKILDDWMASYAARHPTG